MCILLENKGSFLDIESLNQLNGGMIASSSQGRGFESSYI